MKVAVVTAFPPSKVTLNEYGYHLVKNFVQKEEISELVLISDITEEPKQFDFEYSEKIRVQDSWSFNNYFNLFSIIKTVVEHKPDVVFFNLQFMKFGDKKIPAALGLLIPMILTFLGYKTTVLLHNILEKVDLKQAGFSSNSFSVALYSFLGGILTRVILQADVVALTIGKYVELISKKYKVSNVIQVPHGTFETPAIPDYGIAPGAKKVMAFGKFGTYKKVEIMIEAVQKIRKHINESIEIVIAGTDSPNTPGYLASVQKKYCAVDGIIFTGYVEEKEVPTIFNESAVVVFPYTATTGSSGVLHQAGSYGKAVIMPNLGDLSLLIKEEGYRGAFFQPDDSDSLAAAIQDLLTNDSLRREIAHANYQAACALSMDKITAHYCSVFAELLNTTLCHSKA